jgi:hypothetical protein
MSGMATYIEELQNPRWQMKRLEVYERDGARCVMCCDSTTMLVAHHHFYIDGRKPWQYHHSALSTLCDPCHGRWHQRLPRPMVYRPKPEGNHLSERMLAGECELSYRDRASVEAIRILVRYPQVALSVSDDEMFKFECDTWNIFRNAKKCLDLTAHALAFSRVGAYDCESLPTYSLCAEKSVPELSGELEEAVEIVRELIPAMQGGN